MSTLMEYFKEKEKKAPPHEGKVKSLVGFLKGISVASFLPSRYTINQPYTWPFASKSATAHVGIFDTWGKTPFVQWVLRLDKPHPGCEYPHLNINQKLTGVKDAHIAVPGSVVKAGGAATTAINYIGFASLTMAVCNDVYRIGSAMKQDYENDATVVGTRTVNTSIKIAAIWTCGIGGAAIGCNVGSVVGGTVGLLFGGVGAVPCAAVGSLLGKLAGGIAGGMYAATGAKAATDVLMHSKRI